MPGCVCNSALAAWGVVAPAAGEVLPDAGGRAAGDVLRRRRLSLVLQQRALGALACVSSPEAGLLVPQFQHPQQCPDDRRWLHLCRLPSTPRPLFVAMPICSAKEPFKSEPCGGLYNGATAAACRICYKPATKKCTRYGTNGKDGGKWAPWDSGVVLCESSF